MQMQCWEDRLAAARMQRELSYGCSGGSGRAMGSSGSGKAMGSSAEDVGSGGLASAHGLCRIIIVMLTVEYY